MKSLSKKELKNIYGGKLAGDCCTVSCKNGKNLSIDCGNTNCSGFDYNPSTGLDGHVACGGPGSQTWYCSTGSTTPPSSNLTV